ncbi:hypothetical protein D3C81_2005030 [compost metagenome]
MADALLLQVLHQTGDSAKAADAAGQGRGATGLRHARIRINGLHACRMQQGGQNMGIERAA